MKEKYYATAPGTLDGRSYRIGDIVMSDREYPWLRPAKQAVGSLDKVTIEMERSDGYTQYLFTTIFSRKYCVKPFFENLKVLEMPRDRIHWLILIDSEDTEMIEDIKSQARESPMNERLGGTKPYPIYQPV